MRKKLVASWVPSVSTDISHQELVLVANGVEYPPIELNPTVTGWSSEVDDLYFEEGATASVAITVVDLAGNRSETVVAEANYPDVAPAPITGLTLSFEDVA